MICKKCGADIDDNSRFCTYCGADIDMIEPVTDEEASDGNLTEVRIEANKEKPVKTKNNKLLIGVLVSCGAVIIAMLLAVVLFLVGTKDMRLALENNDPVAVCNIYIEAEKEHENIKVSEYDWLITIKIKSIIKVFNEYDYEAAVVDHGDKTVDNLIDSFGVFIYGRGGSSSQIVVVLSDENLDRWNELKEIIKSKRDLCEKILSDGNVPNENKNETSDDSNATSTTNITTTTTTNAAQGIKQPEKPTDQKTLEENLAIGYWRVEDYADVLFRPIKNHDIFDGIVITSEFIIPYKVDGSGNIVLYDVAYEYNETSERYDLLTYEALGEIKEIKNQTSGNTSVQIYNYNTRDTEKITNLVTSNVDLLLKFSAWSDFDCQLISVSEYNTHFYFDLISNDAQKDVTFYDFNSSDARDEGYNLQILIDEFDNDLADVYYDNYTLDAKNHCVYIGDNKYEINKDCSQLYCKETDHTIYRVTDFALGKIADTDFPPGELVVDL